MGRIKIYWTSELYSFGKYYRKYGYYPSFLPLLVYSDHSGPDLDIFPEDHDLTNDAEIYLTFSEEKKKIIEKLTNKNAFTIISPQIFYRRSKKIKQNTEAKGTVFFPMHSLPGKKIDYSIEDYCNKILNLDDKFKPFKICLHHHDINRGIEKIYKKYNFEIITAGNTSSDVFIENLYDILSNTKYTSSNEIGTVSFLSLELGVRFFVYPNENIKHSIDKNKKNTKSELYKILKKNLAIENIENPISNDIKFLVENSLGVFNSISRSKLSYILWKQFFVEIITLSLFIKIFKKGFKKFKIIN